MPPSPVSSLQEEGNDPASAAKGPPMAHERWATGSHHSRSAMSTIVCVSLLPSLSPTNFPFSLSPSPSLSTTDWHYWWADPCIDWLSPRGSIVWWSIVAVVHLSAGERFSAYHWHSAMAWYQVVRCPSCHARRRLRRAAPWSYWLRVPWCLVWMLAMVAVVAVWRRSHHIQQHLGDNKWSLKLAAVSETY